MITYLHAGRECTVHHCFQYHNLTHTVCVCGMYICTGTCEYAVVRMYVYIYVCISQTTDIIT